MKRFAQTEVGIMEEVLQVGIASPFIAAAVTMATVAPVMAFQ